jgi:hypothetical protein
VLELDHFFAALLERPEDDEAGVPWSRVAALLAINRLCAPFSVYPPTQTTEQRGGED